MQKSEKAFERIGEIGVFEFLFGYCGFWWLGVGTIPMAAYRLIVQQSPPIWYQGLGVYFFGLSIVMVIMTIIQSMLRDTLEDPTFSLFKALCEGGVDFPEGDKI